MKKILWIAGIAVLMAGAVTQAAVISGIASPEGTIDSFAWPSETLLGGFNATGVHGTDDWSIGVTGTRVLGQTFTITEDGTIGTIALAGGFSAGTADFTFEFYKVSSVDTGSTPVGGVLDSGTVTAANISAAGFSAGDYGTLVFDVADTSVSAGDVYAFKVVADGTSPITMRRTTTVAQNFSGGQQFGSFTGNDYYVSAYAIPEPATIGSILGFSAFITILIRRRRRG